VKNNCGRAKRLWSYCFLIVDQAAFNVLEVDFIDLKRRADWKVHKAICKKDGLNLAGDGGLQNKLRGSI
jgi:hypothetical protein